VVAGDPLAVMRFHAFWCPVLQSAERATPVRGTIHCERGSMRVIERVQNTTYYADGVSSPLSICLARDYVVCACLPLINIASLSHCLAIYRASMLATPRATVRCPLPCRLQIHEQLPLHVI